MNNKKVKNINGKVGEGVGFERIRRITGYLVYSLSGMCEYRFFCDILAFVITEEKT